jgi:pimeloyl-ACP methyl ester carboxylesterase
MILRFQPCMIRPRKTMPPEPQSIRFETGDGITLHCLHSRPVRPAAATNTPLVLLHGGGANAHWWDHLAQDLAQERPVYALDFRGHGNSDYPANREVGAFGLDLEALLHWLGREDVDLVGHSLGAAIALDHASRFRSTRSVALLDLARGSVRRVGRRARLALSLRRTYQTRNEAIDRYRFLPESTQASEALRLSIAGHSVREEPDGRFGYKFDPGWFSLPSKPRPNPESVTCRTLLLRGEQSHLLSPEAARDFVNQLPNGQLVEIPNAGHHLFLDQPKRSLDLLLAFLSPTADKTSLNA